MVGDMDVVEVNGLGTKGGAFVLVEVFQTKKFLDTLINGIDLRLTRAAGSEVLSLGELGDWSTGKHDNVS